MTFAKDTVTAAVERTITKLRADYQAMQLPGKAANTSPELRNRITFCNSLQLLLRHVKGNTVDLTFAEAVQLFWEEEAQP